MEKIVINKGCSLLDMETEVSFEALCNLMNKQRKLVFKIK